MKLGTVGFVTIIGMALYLGVKIIPPMFHNYQFRDEVRTVARLSTYSNADDAAVLNDVLRRARACDVNLSYDDIDLKRTPAGVKIRIEYDVPVNIPVRPFVMHFSADSTEVF
jgi:hypothetical protein